MTLEQLLDRLAADDVRLRRSGDRLDLYTAGGAPAPPVIDGLRAHKPALLAMIADGGVWPPPIRPEMLPLVTLTQAEIDAIVAGVPGGAANVQDIYPLAPLQEGILFHHHLATEGDPYLLAGISRVESRERLDAYLGALQRVVDRHDVLRTAVVWEGLPEPVQVVWRKADLPVDVVDLDGAEDAAAELYRRFDPRRHRIDLGAAPLLRVHVARDGREGGWLMLTLLHHLAGDHTTMDLIRAEVRAHLAGREGELPEPLPFRNLVAQARLGVPREEHERFFRALLAGVDEPTAPFGLLDTHGDGSGVAEARLEVEATLAARLRERARRLGGSAAAICHVAWALVLARASGRGDVVFGTLLFGRMQGGEGADRVMGPFINTLPVRIAVGHDGAEEGVRRAHALLIDLLHHEHASLALAQQCSDVRPPLPLFTSLLNYRYGTRAPADAGPSPHGIRALHGDERTNYPLLLSIDDLGDGFRLVAQAPDAVGPARVCAMAHAALERLVDALETAPGTALAELDVLPEAERRTLVDEWNRTEAYPAERCIHQRFEAQAERSPGSVAVSAEDGSLTYAELNARANRLAHHLIALGVGPDARVAVCAGRSVEMVVALLAVLKAGGGYVPLDPSYPAARLRHVLADSAPAVLLTHGAPAALLAEARVPRLDLAADAARWADRPEANPDASEVGVRPEHLAYVIYTSGSTGAPKGVMVEHRNVARLFTATDAWFGFGADDVWTLFHSFAFDFSVWEMWGALLHGGRLVVVPFDVTRAPEEFHRLIVREGVTVLNQTPSAFRQLIAAQAASSSGEGHRLRCVVFGGEALEPATLRPWFARPENAGTRLVNMYGITETTVHVTYRPIEPADAERGGASPIGVRIPDLTTYVLDPNRRPAPIGVTGELYVGGAGVARGYLDRPELTAERFVRDPFSADLDARLYRTGDLARWTAEGGLEYLGRNDFQVKIRGFRIELGEIEARLLDHPAVREAVVAAREDGDGDRRLVAYVVAAEGESAEAERLRTHLAAHLPEHMVPAAYVRLDALPLTPNGKLDRAALPAPDGDAFARRGYEPPLGEVETALAEIWAEVLGVERVGRLDNFFALGGHSLRVVTLIERMRRRGLHAEVRALFTTPTLAALAAAVGAEPRGVAVPPTLIPEAGPVRPEMLPLVALTQGEIDRIVAGVPGGAANVQDVYPLAPLQEGILFHHRLAREGDPYLVAHLSRVDTRESLDAYLAALQRVVDRHDILRTAVVWDGLSEPVQVVWRRAHLPVTEARLEDGDDAAAELYRRFDPRRHRIDVRTAPLLRVYVARDGREGGWLMLVLLHHLAGDHTTMDVIRGEVRAHLTGREGELPPPLPFRTLVAQARLGVPREEHERFFRALLGDVDEPTAPFGLLDARGDGTGIAEARLEVDPALADRLRARARRLGVSAAALCHVAWARVLARTSGRDDVVFGTVLFGRMQAGEGADRVMGPFINTLPVRLRAGEDGAEAGVRRAHALLVDLLHHEHASLALAQQCSAVQAPLPLFTSLLNYRYGTRAPAAAGRAPDRVRGLRSDERTNYPLVLSVDDLGDGFDLVAQVFDAVGPARVCAMMHAALERLVDALETAPETALADVDVLPEAERRMLVDEWNRTEAYPAECIHRLFEAQAERTPGSVAVSAEGGSLTYARLNARANRLAHHLRALGVGPDARVAVCVERGMEMVVALLAVLKAGGGYLPLDPAYPDDRLRDTLADGAPAAVLTQAPLAARFAGAGVPVVDVGGGGAWEAYPASNPDPAEVGVRPEHLAYVIHTSGSTGRPKGVMIEHRHVARLFRATEAWFGFGPDDVWTLLHSFAFDFSVWEMWGALLHGGRLVVVPRDTARSPEEVYRLIRREGVTVLNQTPSAFRQLIAAQGASAETGHRLRCVIFGGEALEPATLWPWFARAENAGTRLVNMYGITETTVHVTYRPIEPADTQRGGASPIGVRIPDLTTYVLDPAGRPAPIGVAGELYVGGAGVARGYLDRPELTAERFVRDPFSADPDARLYRTGDLARWTAEGTLEYLGRNDFQVKIRGFRIELGEIEARLAEHAAVREAVVLARDDGRGDGDGDRRLVAYWVGGEAGVEALRAHLAERLPEHMVPAAYVRLDAFPLTPNGKLDRAALPAPDGGAFARRGYEPPVWETETMLAAMWSEILGVGRVGRWDDFFDLGGHSLLATRLALRINRDMGVEIALWDLFDAPVLCELARRILEIQLGQFDPEALARLRTPME